MVRIEKVSYTKRQGGSYILSLDDGSALDGVDERTLAEMGLRRGRELAEAELERLRRAEALSSAHALVAGFMHYRPRSRKEVRERLARAGTDKDVTEQVLSELEEKGAINDAGFAREWVRSKALGGRSGEKLIRKQLVERGVSRREIDEALAAELPREGRLNAATQLAEKKARGRDLSDPRERKKVQYYLLRRGFDWEVVEEAMKGIADCGTAAGRRSHGDE